ncbi:DinB family protein [Cohnella caldifontis]|uniref:DinB family protein n=1 Tax=Cohnella caldifontis TaxID=3027471 RepID=UPI0023EB9E7B|nr:DinB family protein [Cohnella sp. YIM B05605]
MNRDDIVELYDYNIWANGRILGHLKTLPEDVFHREVNLGFKSVADVIGHIAAADEVWLTRLEGSSPSSLASKPFANVEEAERSMHRIQSRIRQILSSVDDMEQPVIYRNTKGDEFRNSISEIARHVVNHGTYHRGNVSTILRALGHTGVQTDYIAYLRK